MDLRREHNAGGDGRAPHDSSLTNDTTMLNEHDQSASGRTSPETGTVSILIPTYNRADHLRAAVNSAIQQTYDDLEILVLDDASTDATDRVVASFDDPRIEYIRHEDNLGPNRNWRSGIRAAEGEFFCFLPDDDVFGPQFVERLVEALRDDPEAILAFSDHWVMGQQGRTLPEVSEQNSATHNRDELAPGRLDDFERTALIDDSIYIGAVLFRRAFVSPSFLDPEAQSAMGSWILYECIRTGRPAVYVPERLMRCRWHDGALTRSQEWIGSITEGNIRRYRRMLEDDDLRRFRDEIQEKLAIMLQLKGRMYLCRGETEAARAALSEALERDPSLQAVLTYGLAQLGPAAPPIARTLRALV